MNMPNINVNKEQVIEAGKATLGYIKSERGTVAACAAAILAGLCYWSQRKLIKMVEGK